jgi:catechol 2,3-dioxygenase-like lactoylglutathione lyase family enzyme
MSQFISAISLVITQYDEAIAFYVDVLGFNLIEDTPMGANKRWVTVQPKGATETLLLLAEATTDEQRAAIGHQAGGRVFLFLKTTTFDADYQRMLAKGVTFLEQPRSEPYGKVVVFQDPFGNKWDLLENITA